MLTLLSCATKITHLNSPQGAKHGLILSLNMDANLAKDNCKFILSSNDQKDFFIDGSQFANKPQLLELPSGKYSFQSIRCASFMGSDVTLLPLKFNMI
jgi:hypothetical protein